MEDTRYKTRSVEVAGNTYNTNYHNTHDNNMNFPKTNSNPSGMQDLRCYSASYASSSNGGQLDIVVAGGGAEQWKFKKGKSTSGAVSKSWSFSDPEVQRKKRVATYKAYTVEGKVKGSFKKSIRWIKERYSLMVYGYR